jgi:hypothetical protein
VLFALAGCFRDAPAARPVPDGAAALSAALAAAAADYLDETVTVDFAACVVTLPGLMQPFLRDFGKVIPRFHLTRLLSCFLPSLGCRTMRPCCFGSPNTCLPDQKSKWWPFWRSSPSPPSSSLRFRSMSFLHECKKKKGGGGGGRKFLVCLCSKITTW